MFCFHKWKKVGNYEYYDFEGESCQRFNQKYLWCSKCNKVQGLTKGAYSGWWRDLNQCESLIVIRKINNEFITI